MSWRWKKEPAPTGLMAVGAGRLRASRLHDGTNACATVYPSGGNWRGPLRGWYWVAYDLVPYCNTSSEPLYPTEKEAKAAAFAYVKQHIGSTP